MQNKRISDNTAPPADLNRERGSDMSWSLLTVWYLELKERRHYCINHASERKHNTDILFCPLLSTIFLTLFLWQRQWTSTRDGYVDRDLLIVCCPGFRLLSVSRWLSQCAQLVTVIGFILHACAASSPTHHQRFQSSVWLCACCMFHN